MQLPLDTKLSIAELTDNPYPIYKALRSETPLLKVSSLGRTLVTKFKDIHYIKMHPELFSSDDPNTPMERAFEAKTLMRRDGEDHMRLRTAMMPAMGPARVKNVWAQRVNNIADEFVERLTEGATVDLFSAFAGPFSARCVAMVLGIPKASDDNIQRWSQALIDGAGNFGLKDEPFAQAYAANREINACIDDAQASYKANDEDSALAVQLNAATPIEKEHIISNIKIAIGGGINEPRDAILTTLFGLLSNPSQLAEAKNNPTLFLRAFEEGIRWVAPIQLSSRRVLKDTEIRGFHIPAGEVVMTVQASANHDEEEYEDGHLFNIFRDNKRHQSFGNGPHFCMGTHLSRKMVGEIALPKLFERFPNMRLAEDQTVKWSGFGFRGPLNLPVVLER